MTESNVDNAAPESSPAKSESQPSENRPETESKEVKPESQPSENKSETESKEVKPESQPSENKSKTEPEETKPESQPPENKSKTELKEVKPESQPSENKSKTEPEETKPESQLTPCPLKSSSPELEDKSRWKEYPSATGKNLFHGGQNVYLENTEPTPQQPQQECVYDKNTGDLVTKDHPFAGIRGTPNQYNGNGSLEERYKHTFPDEGGIWENGREALRDSMTLHGNDLRDSIVLYGNDLRDYLENKLEKLGLSGGKSKTSVGTQTEKSGELERQREKE